MKKVNQPSLQLAVITGPADARCFWCGKALRNCGTCKGSGQFKGAHCKSCNGLGLLCSVHEADWEE